MGYCGGAPGWPGGAYYAAGYATKMVAGSLGSNNANSFWKDCWDTTLVRLKFELLLLILSLNYLRQNLMHRKNLVQPPFMNQILNTGSLGSDPGVKGLLVPVK